MCLRWRLRLRLVFLVIITRRLFTLPIDKPTASSTYYWILLTSEMKIAEGMGIAWELGPCPQSSIEWIFFTEKLALLGHRPQICQKYGPHSGRRLKKGCQLFFKVHSFLASHVKSWLCAWLKARQRWKIRALRECTPSAKANPVWIKSPPVSRSGVRILSPDVESRPGLWIQMTSKIYWGLPCPMVHLW